MAHVIRLVTIDRGLDPRDYALVAFGGAGPLHACGVADAVGMNRTVVPPHPGLRSALALLSLHFASTEFAVSASGPIRPTNLRFGGSSRSWSVRCKPSSRATGQLPKQASGRTLACRY